MQSWTVRIVFSPTRVVPIFVSDTPMVVHHLVGSKFGADCPRLRRLGVAMAMPVPVVVVGRVHDTRSVDMADSEDKKFEPFLVV